MAQFDVYALPNDFDMLFVDLQSGAVDAFNARLMAPLVPLDPSLKPIGELIANWLLAPKSISSCRN